jgi:hypothetical protein
MLRREACADDVLAGRYAAAAARTSVMSTQRRR